jgi:hypothetical protein
MISKWVSCTGAMGKPCELLERNLGPPIEEFDLRDVFSGERQKNSVQVTSETSKNTFDAKAWLT